jgi:peptidoglycan/xylan/chitin deacetylase (PgdA/CDA1 family)
MMNRLVFSFICCLISSTLFAQRPVGLDDQVRKIAFTFDDGDTASYKGFPLNQWNNQILQALDKNQLKAIFYVHGKNKMNDKGRFILQSWNDRGHLIGNHSFAHKNYSPSKGYFSVV